MSTFTNITNACIYDTRCNVCIECRIDKGNFFKQLFRIASSCILQYNTIHSVLILYCILYLVWIFCTVCMAKKWLMVNCILHTYCSVLSPFSFPSWVSDVVCSFYVQHLPTFLCIRTLYLQTHHTHTDFLPQAMFTYSTSYVSCLYWSM